MNDMYNITDPSGKKQPGMSEVLKRINSCADIENASTEAIRNLPAQILENLHMSAIGLKEDGDLPPYSLALFYVIAATATETGNAPISATVDELDGMLAAVGYLTALELMRRDESIDYRALSIRAKQPLHVCVNNERIDEHKKNKSYPAGMTADAFYGVLEWIMKYPKKDHP